MTNIEKIDKFIKMNPNIYKNFMTKAAILYMNKQNELEMANLIDLACGDLLYQTQDKKLVTFLKNKFYKFLEKNEKKLWKIKLYQNVFFN